MDPLDYMVEDCWLHLFPFLSAKDKQALCGTCETFRAMLQPEKVKWGFELVLPYILKELDRAYPSYQQKNELVKSVLKLRHVCKDWREGFDRLIGNHGIDYSYTFITHSVGLVGIIQRKYRFSGVRGGYGLFMFGAVGDQQPASEKFLTFFKDYCGNPFIGRRVFIDAVPSGVVESENQENTENEDISMEEENQEEDGNRDEGELEDDNEEDAGEIGNWRADQERRELAQRERTMKIQELLLELLSKYGEEIDHLHLDRVRECPLLDAYKFLQTVLCNCPNLQSLQIKLRNMYGQTEDEQTENDCGFQRRLAEYFEMNELPKMRRLWKLQLCKMNAGVENLMLEAYGPNLRSLERLNAAAEIPVSTWGSMKCLKKLILNNASFEHTETLLRAITSPMKTLILEKITYKGTPQRFFKIDTFLQAIQHLPLKLVIVHCIDGEPLKESAPFPADFPKHKTISKVSIGAAAFSLNFIRFLPELQSLYINGGRFLWKQFVTK